MHRQPQRPRRKFAASADPLRRLLRLEPLEDRRLLATVDTLLDVNANDGLTSLREAIAAATPGETIDFSVTGSINLTSLGQLVIDKNLTINGPGAGLLTVRAFAGTGAAGDGARIFNVDDGNVATFKDVSISGLTLTGGDTNSNGGAIRISTENLTISGCTISGNSAVTGGGISNNSGGHLSVSGSTISSNTASARAGGIETIGGSVSVTQSTISGNSSVGNGGGVYGTSSTIAIDSSTISGNSSTNANGGGVFHTGVGILTTITNSTISGNSARSDGGGVAAVFGDVIVRHSTITLNKADSDNNGTGNGGGVFVASAASNATTDHTIVAGNLRHVSTRDDISGAVTARYSLIGDNTGAIITNQGGNRIGSSGLPINPLMGSLADNGGRRLTHAFLAGSPALDAGDPAAMAGVGNVPLRDQRSASFVRVFDGDGDSIAVIDIGAFEQQPFIFVVDSLADEDDGNFSTGDVSLREVVAMTNDRVGADTIAFAPSLTSGGPAVILLSLGELQITDAVSVDGPGADLLTIDASGNDQTPDENNGDGSRVFRVDNGSSILIIVSISGLSLTGGDISGNGGAVLSLENLTISLCSLSGNFANNSGGGIFVSDSLTTIEGSTISGNSAVFGGGILSNTNLTGTQTTTITNSTISGNSAASLGGGVLNSDGLTIIQHTTITNNTAPAGFGSGIESFGDNVTRTEVHSSIIAGNTNSDVDFTSGVVNSFQSNRYNLIGGGNAVGEFDRTGDQTGVTNPMVGPLADNGGPTMTHALLAGSPAIHAGDPAAMAGVGDVPPYDQRGFAFSRVVNGRIDIGAFERDAVSADFDIDLDVDGSDFLAWQRGLGLTGAAVSRAQGNADGDSDVDGDDLAVWRSQFGTAPSVSAAAPTSAAALTSTDRPGAQPALADAVFASFDLSGLFAEPEGPVRWKGRSWRR